MTTDETRPDIASAKSRMRVTFGGGKEIKRLPEHLWDREQVERMTTGSYQGGSGLLVLTDRRLLFLKEGMLSKKSEDFPLDKVSSIQWSSGMMLGTVTVFASGNKAEIKNVNKDDGKDITDLVRARVSTSKPTAAGDAPSAVHVDPADQLRKLGELRDAGVLTPEEFEAKKADLLARM